MHPNAEPRYKELQATHDTLAAEIAVLEAKVTPDEVILRSFVAPKRENVEGYSREDFTSLAEMAKFIHKTPDLTGYELEGSYSGDVTITHSFIRPETDDEYNHRVGNLRNRFLQDSPIRVADRPIRKNLKSLRKKFGNIGQEMNRLNPPKPPLEMLQDTIAGLPQDLQDKILEQTKLVAWRRI